jgi:hypothetical protein
MVTNLKAAIEAWAAAADEARDKEDLVFLAWSAHFAGLGPVPSAELMEQVRNSRLRADMMLADILPTMNPTT